MISHVCFSVHGPLKIHWPSLAQHDSVTNCRMVVFGIDAHWLSEVQHRCHTRHSVGRQTWPMIGRSLLSSYCAILQLVVYICVGIITWKMNIIEPATWPKWSGSDRSGNCTLSTKTSIAPSPHWMLCRKKKKKPDHLGRAPSALCSGCLPAFHSWLMGWLMVFYQ